MAGRRSLVALKKKKVTAGKSVQYIADIRHMGEEPDLKGKFLDERLLSRTFNWYNYMCTRVQAREYIEAYLKANKRVGDLKVLKKVADVWIIPQAGWLARIVARGGILSDVYVQRLELRLTEIFAKAEIKTEVPAEEKKPAAVVISIQDRVKDKVSNFIAEFEKAIDEEGWTLSMYDWLQNKEIPANLANKVAEFYKPIAEEAAELISKKCNPSLKEGYATYTADQLKRRAAFYQGILADCARHSGNVKKQRVVRKKKVVTIDKKLKSFKFQKESPEFKVVSINPEKIVGAEELVTFNTRYKLLTHFVAAGNKGLDVKGTTILHYDEEKSKTYHIGRKTEEHLETALRGGKRAFAKMIGSLKTTTTQHRINENTILLKV